MHHVFYVNNYSFNDFNSASVKSDFHLINLGNLRECIPFESIDFENIL